MGILINSVNSQYSFNISKSYTISIKGGLISNQIHQIVFNNTLIHINLRNMVQLFKLSNIQL